MPDDAPTRTRPPAEPDATRTEEPRSPDATTATGPTSASAPDTCPATIGRFVILGELARGGMGVVYRAHDPAFDREVAVKLLAERLVNRPEAIRRFTEESRVTGQLQHPGIPPVHDLGTLPDGQPFLAMKLIKGQTLDELLKERRDPATNRSHYLGIFEQVCQAVAYAHAHRVIHRDLKPANVMVGAFSEVQVMDWGLAKVLTVSREAQPSAADPDATLGTEIHSVRADDGLATQAGSVLGTPAFMPPEQAGGEVEKIDERADVFGLGAILCVILTGQPPYVGDSSESVRLMAVRGQLTDCLARLDRCGAEPGLVELCERCLSFAATDRPRNADEVAKAVVGLRSAAEDRARQAELNEARAAVEAAEQRKRRRIAGVLSAAVVLALGAGAVATFIKYRDEAAQRSIADGERTTAEGHLKTAQAESKAKDDALQRLKEQQAVTEEALVSNILRPLRTTTDQLSDRLTADEARVLRELAALPDERLQHRFIETALTTPGGPQKLYYRAPTVIHAIAGWDRDRAARLRGAVDGWLAAGTGGKEGQVACVLLIAALPQSDPAKDAAAAAVLLERLTVQNATYFRYRPTLQALLARLGRDRATEVAGPAARAIVNQLSRKVASVEFLTQVQTWTILAPWLDPSEELTQARHVARIIHELIEAQTVQLSMLTSCLAMVLNRLSPTEATAQVAGPIATIVRGLTTKPKSIGFNEFGMVYGILALAPYLDATSAALASRALADELVGRLKTENLASIDIRVAALGSLLRHMLPADAQALATPLARELSGRITQTKAQNPLAVSDLISALKELLPFLRREDAAVLAGPLARLSAQRLPDADPIVLLADMSSFCRLAQALDPAEAKPIVQQMIRAYAKQVRSKTALIPLAGIQAVSELASTYNLDPDVATELARAFISMVSDVQPSYASASFKEAVRWAPRLGPKEGALLVRSLSGQLAKLSTPEHQNRVAEGLAALFRWQTDADIVARLKAHGGVPNVAPAALGEFNRRLGRNGTPATRAALGTAFAHGDPPFASVWELIAWGEVNRPDLDFRSPPSKTP